VEGHLNPPPLSKNSGYQPCVFSNVYQREWHCVA